MGPKSRLLLLALAAALIVLVLAVPAMAASNMTKGDSQILVPKNMVVDLQTKHTTINAFGDILYKPRWASNTLTWWYDVPMAMKSGANYSTYNVKTGKGIFYHSGQLIWIDSGQAAQKGLKWQGLRIQAVDKNHYSLIATVGNTKPYTPNITLATSSATTSITHSGKRYHIAGIKFRLMPTAAAQLKAATGEDYSQSLLLFDGDLFFTMK